MYFVPLHFVHPQISPGFLFLLPCSTVIDHLGDEYRLTMLLTLTSRRAIAVLSLGSTTYFEALSNSHLVRSSTDRAAGL